VAPVDGGAGFSERMNGTTVAKILRGCLRPEYAARYAIRKFSLGSPDYRLSMQSCDRPQYAFGVKEAIDLASKLKLPRVSVIESGVAAGDGLLVPEAYAEELGRRAGIELEVYGFDTGYGLPAASGYRDLGYVWKRGAFRWT